MKSIILGAAIAAAFTVSASAAELAVSKAYAFATPASGKAGAAYVTIVGSDADDRLIGVDSDIARRVEIHEHKMIADVMKMRRVEGGIDLPADGMIEMAPGGYHIMLMGLNDQLIAGEMFPVTLTFDSGAELIAEVMVIERDAAEAGHAGHGAKTGHAGHGTPATD